MPHPYLTIDLDKIEHNARTIVGLCRQYDIEVTGVTKVTCGNPDVAQAMLRGGVASIGESHIENIQRMKAAGVHTAYMLLQIPPLSGVDEVVDTVDVSLNSELSVLEGLSAAAMRRGQIHDVILMVDLGDLREGIWPADLVPFVREALRLRGIRIKGLGTNLACFGAVAPSEDNMHQLVELAREIEAGFGLTLEWISGANSSGLKLIAAGRMPTRVNHARMGEAILLGRETIRRQPWPGTFQDAFGRLPVFEDRGERMRALLNVGREDVDLDGIAPIDGRIMVLGGSSDYLVVDVTGAAGVRVGDELTFSVKYGALLAAMTSEYVKKRPLRAGVPVYRRADV